MKKTGFYILMLFIFNVAKAQQDSAIYHEQYRPQIHFSPKAHWMNDPNGMVYNEGVYHLFFQYYPGGTTWGPMHWGHATSADLMHWQEQQIALYPDSLGYIFSGSAVADKNNTSGFGEKGKTPLVAIYTSHDTAGERAGRNNYENESIAYSLDNGKSWVKYSGNPVVKNPGIRDFRDPKVSWHEESKQWIMTLATKDRITFFSSPNLRDWTKESEFGEHAGAHGGVWECPDLFTLNYGGKKVWILVVNLNPGGPNGGSATQYFTGNFDGHIFTPFDTTVKWMDYGPDEYAGVTWSNTGDRKIFLGWMTNWDYAGIVPTQKWRSAMTVPRALALAKINNTFLVTSMPVKELSALSIAANTSSKSTAIMGKANITTPCVITVSADVIKDCSFIFFNETGEKLIVGYNKDADEYFIDRSNAGKADFKQGFAAKHTAPRFAKSNKLQLTIVVDAASAELFADGGLTVMTATYFPSTPFNQIQLPANNQVNLKVQATTLKSIWR